MMPRVRRCRQPGCHNLVAYPDHYCSTHHVYEAEYQHQRQAWHDANHTHHYNTVVRKRDSTKREQYSFYRTKQWVHLRQRVLDRDHYLCQYCLAQGVVKPGKVADHIVPYVVSPEHRTDIDNLTTACATCHRLKTAWEQEHYFSDHDVIDLTAEQITDVKIISNLFYKK